MALTFCTPSFRLPYYSGIRVPNERWGVSPFVLPFHMSPSLCPPSLLLLLLLVILHRPSATLGATPPTPTSPPAPCATRFRTLVLDGGGVKGAVYSGAALALEEAGVSFDAIAGTSAGSSAAVMLAAGFTACEFNAQVMGTSFQELGKCGSVGRGVRACKKVWMNM